MRTLWTLLVCVLIAACDPHGRQAYFSNDQDLYPVRTYIERLEDYEMNPLLWIRAQERPTFNRTEEGVVEITYTCPCAVSTSAGGIATIAAEHLTLKLAEGAPHEVLDGDVTHYFPQQKRIRRQ